MLSRAPIGKNLVRGCVRLNASVVPSKFSAQAMTMRAFSAEQRKVYGIHAHDGTEYLKDDKSGDHVGRQQNHIWSAEEIDSELKSLYRHKPVTISDKFMNFVVSFMLLVANASQNNSSSFPFNPDVHFVQVL